MATKTHSNATIWLSELGDSEALVLANEKVIVETERTDVNEIAVHATLPGDDNAIVSIYLTRDKAAVLAADLLQRR